MAKKRPRRAPAQELVPSGKPTTPAPAADRLLGDIRALIKAARQQVARAVNSAMVALYWHVGRRIREDILHAKRAGYGHEIVSALSAQLTMEYGRGFGRRNLFRMMQSIGPRFCPRKNSSASCTTPSAWRANGLPGRRRNRRVRAGAPARELPGGRLIASVRGGSENGRNLSEPRRPDQGASN
jgi:hypothetical protein